MKITRPILNWLKKNEKFYLENLRAKFKMDYDDVNSVLKLLENEGLIIQKWAITCPMCSRVVREIKKKEELPDHEICTTCEDLEGKFEWEPSWFDTIPVYYSLTLNPEQS